MSENKVKEIVILSDCSKDYKAGRLVYETLTDDKDYEGPRAIHPTNVHKLNNKDFKIHFFEIQDSYWPAISNICRHCDGAAFVIDMEDYTEEGGAEFIKEWLINLDDLDKSEMKTIIIGVTKTDKAKDSKGIDEINKVAGDKKIDYIEVQIEEGKKDQPKAKKLLTDAFEKLAKLINSEADDGDKNKGDDEMDEYLDKYKNF